MISARSTPSCRRSQPSSSTAPAPNLIGGGPQGKTVSLGISTMTTPLDDLRRSCHVAAEVLHQPGHVPNLDTHVVWRSTRIPATNCPDALDSGRRRTGGGGPRAAAVGLARLPTDAAP